jgi:hypothetical protein
VQPGRFRLCLVGAAMLAAPLARSNSEAPSPERKAFELPTYTGEKPTYHAPPKKTPPAPPPDARDLYERALACWPAPSYMRAEVSVEGRVRSDNGSYVDTSGAITGGSRAGVSLVARLPLYSAAEMDREREREYGRRVKVADAVGAFVTALGEREKHKRELELMRALERRSQERVKIGVAETSEQVRYLEKVAGIEGELLKLRGQIQKARLEMIGHCSAPTADGLDRHLVQFIGL